MKNSNLDTINQFLIESALIQTTYNDFKLFLGPLRAVNDIQQAFVANQILLYKPDFWDFLQPEKNSACFFSSAQVLDLKRDDLVQFLLNIRCTENHKRKDLKSPDSHFSRQNETIWKEPDYKSFCKQYEWVKEKIKSGELLKGLPITCQKGDVPDFDLTNYLLFVLENSANTVVQKNNMANEFIYAYWKNGQGFIGQTPEILLKAQKHSVETMALAGTWKKTEESANFNDYKIRQEHQFVIDDVKNQMQSFALTQQQPTTVAELKHLYHLKTEMQYELLTSQSLFEVAQKLHPTAALGLYPRNNQLFYEFSDFVLQSQRKNFGAPFGFFSKEESLLIVAIRNFYFTKSDLSSMTSSADSYLLEIFSGCGVTADSHIDLEWQELTAKRQSVKINMGLPISELDI